MVAGALGDVFVAEATAQPVLEVRAAGPRPPVTVAGNASYRFTTG